MSLVRWTACHSPQPSRFRKNYTKDTGGSLPAPLEHAKVTERVANTP